uniref:Kunitz/Bovine pancreatic trypsin inhibitor domain protein n=2 Tax=Ascaris TaxID=6251 RepID=A0A0M3I5J1_ASCLU
MGEMDICEYWSLIGELTEHPECIDTIEETTSKPTTKPLLLSTCSSSAELVQCTHDSVTCPRSGQACLQTNGKKCCQAVTRGVPASDINAKAGSCPTPPGISVPKDTAVGCWLDSGCPGVQKCCVEPNPTTNSAARICRDPVGVSSTSICILPLVVGSCNAPSTRFYYDSASGKCNTFQYSGCGGNSNNFQSLTSCQATCEASGVIGTPACPAKANAGLNCFFEHKDACRTDSDCLGRESNVQPSCCRTTCGHRICYLY